MTPDAEPTFGGLEGRVLTLFGAGDFDGALEVTRETSARFPDRLAYTSFWTACIEGVRGEPEKALRALTDAAESSDVWWGRELLHEDPDLETLRALPEFEELVGECERRGRAAKARARVEWAVIEPPEQSGHRGALVVLHGRTGNLADLRDRWEAGADAGVTTVLVQSSQMVADGMHCWDDLDVADRDMAEVVRATAGPGARVVLAGFSQGGGIAARMALSGEPVRARGFVSIAPSFRGRGARLEDLSPMLPAAAGAGVRAWLAMGEKDERHRRPAERVAHALDEAGVTVEAIVMEGLGHEYPEPFDEVLAGAVSYVLD